MHKPILGASDYTVKCVVNSWVINKSRLSLFAKQYTHFISRIWRTAKWFQTQCYKDFHELNYSEYFMNSFHTTFFFFKFQIWMQMASRHTNWMVTFSPLSATFMVYRAHFPKHVTRASKQSEVVRISFPAHWVSTPGHPQSRSWRTLTAPHWSHQASLAPKEKLSCILTFFSLSFLLYLYYYYPFTLPRWSSSTICCMHIGIMKGKTI